MRHEVAATLAQLGLTQYIDRLEREGFDEWSSLCDITESDLEALDIKRGHRRILLRHIATIRGHPATVPLDDGSSDGGHDGDAGSGHSDTVSTRRPSLASVATDDAPYERAAPAKRRYKRHPKADENAPARPPSAYVMFANRIRDEERESKYTFTQLARVVGDRWKTLERSEKEKIEAQAAELKRKYTKETDAYRKSTEYQLYQDYLSDFKERAIRDEKPEKLAVPKRKQRAPAGITRSASNPSMTTIGSSVSEQSSPKSSNPTQSPGFMLTSVNDGRPDEATHASHQRLPPIHYATGIASHAILPTYTQQQQLPPLQLPHSPLNGLPGVLPGLQGVLPAMQTGAYPVHFNNAPGHYDHAELNRRY